MQPDQKLVTEITAKLTKEFADKGLIMESGWQIMRALMLKDTSEVQQKEMRKAFYLGAQHLFSAIMGILDPGTEETPADLDRIDKISNELDRFIEEMKAEQN